MDEAHNLVDRSREMYSASLHKSAVYGVKKALGKAHRRLSAALTKTNREFIALRRRCEEAETRALTLPKGVPELEKQLVRLCAACEGWLEEHREGELHTEVLALYFDVRFFLRIAEEYDEKYTALVFASGSEVCVRLLCLDAAPFLEDSLALGRAGILFSATLTPAEYFIRTLGGGEKAKAIGLRSPFAPERLFLAAADTVSTKYADRERTREAVCRLIGAAVNAKAGNYLVFLPSYQYLRDVSDEFAMIYPEIPLAVQESGMDEAAREAFLAQFSAQQTKTLVGFCVLGGIFAEGIDLVGDRLIGSIIVGVGLPQIGPEQDALRDYYEATLGEGFAYAYQYPGMNKVLQAAGRVIRTETDRGLVLLIDSRYRTARYRRLFPPHWAQLQSVESPEQLARMLAGFWNAEK